MSLTPSPNMLPAAPTSPIEVALPRRGQILRRTARILTLAGRFAFGWWLAQQAWSYGPRDTRAERERRRARWLKQQLVQLGPTFIKIGQTLSTRVDLLPLTYVDEMATLQDRIPPFDTALARRFIEAELGAPVETFFRDFPSEPLAAASLGQVYRTWLHDGTEVAVKVQRPNLLETFAVDLAVLRRLAEYVEQRTDWLPGIELVDILDEFGKKLHEEVDYRREADNADRFRANFAHYPGVAVPLMHRATSSRRVLTMEFMVGTKVTDLAALKAMGVDPAELVVHAVQVNLKQLLEDGFYHADLHPGNILVDHTGRLIFIDFGLVGTIPKPMRAQLVEAFLHIVDRDIDALVQDLILLGFLRPGQEPGPLKPTIRHIIDSAFAPYDKRPTFKEMTDPMAEIFYRYHLRVPVTFSFIFRTLISLEGIGYTLDPGFHPFDVAIPYAAKLLLSQAGEDIRNRLVDEIFTPDGLDWTRLFELFELARRDPGFRLGQVTELGVAWIVSKDGRVVRDKVLDALLGDDPIPWERLEALIALAQQDPSFDLMAVMGPLINFFLTPEGAPFRQGLVWKIGKDLLTGRLGEWAGLYKVVRAIF